MADAIRQFRYTTPGRGRGVLGMVDFEPCRKPGVAGSSVAPGLVCGPGQPKKEQNRMQYRLASFPGHSHCQYLIACSMQIYLSNTGGGNGLGVRLVQAVIMHVMQTPTWVPTYLSSGGSIGM